jgi:hypothetical protein
MQRIVLAIILLFVLSFSVYGDELYEPPRLFNIPTAPAIRSLDLNASGGVTFATGEFSFLGSGLIGLGDVAQFELSTFGAFSRFGEGETDLLRTPAAGVKVYLPFDRVSKFLPAISGAFRRSFGEKEEGEEYQRQLADLYLMASKRFFSGTRWRGFSLHAGADYLGARLTDLHSNEAFTKNFLMPFAGIEVWIAPKVKLMGEFEWTPSFKEDDPKEKIDSVWMTIGGVRYFLTHFITIDIGVKYREDFDSIADANVESRIAVSIPTHLIYKE